MTDIRVEHALVRPRGGDDHRLYNGCYRGSGAPVQLRRSGQLEGLQAHGPHARSLAGGRRAEHRPAKYV